MHRIAACELGTEPWMAGYNVAYTPHCALEFWVITNKLQVYIWSITWCSRHCVAIRELSWDLGSTAKDFQKRSIGATCTVACSVHVTRTQDYAITHVLTGTSSKVRNQQRTEDMNLADFGYARKAALANTPVLWRRERGMLCLIDDAFLCDLHKFILESEAGRMIEDTQLRRWHAECW